MGRYCKCQETSLGFIIIAIHYPPVWLACAVVHSYLWRIKACAVWFTLLRILAKLMQTEGRGQAPGTRSQRAYATCRCYSCSCTQIKALLFYVFLLYLLVKRFNYQTDFIFIFLRLLRIKLYHTCYIRFEDLFIHSSLYTF